MKTTLIAAVIAACLVGAVFAGMWFRRLLPPHHLGADTKDAVKLAMGLVATMAALLLGLLVSSAKGTYDTERTQVIQMAAKVAFLDRLLELYGPEAADSRVQFRAAVEDAVRRVWPERKDLLPELGGRPQGGEAVYSAIHALNPQNDMQRSLKAQAATLAAELGELRSLLVAESVSSISTPLLVMVVCWLLAIFFSFSLLAPSNATATVALMVSAFSVAGALFLILELDHPFGGLIQIPSEPMLKALGQLVK